MVMLRAAMNMAVQSSPRKRKPAATQNQSERPDFGVEESMAFSA